MGLFATVAERLAAEVHFVHHVEEQGDGGLQDRGPRRVSQIVGHSEKSLVNELR